MDALQFTLALDQKVERSLEPLATHYSAFTIQSPRTLSDAVSLSKPVLAVISEWLEEPIGPPDPEKLAFMKTLSV